MTSSLKFGSIDGEAFVWAPGEAWIFDGSKWSRANSAEIGMDGRVLSKEAFRAKFPSLPPLPSSAFHSDDVRAEAPPKGMDF
ncbi:hypothetical protein RAD16_05210 [Bradyrhizobium sp. 18BD]